MKIRLLATGFWQKMLRFMAMKFDKSIYAKSQLPVPANLITYKQMTIRVSQINKFYGAQKVLDEVSFEIGTGELVGFLGPNGAGKSTMMKIITGYLSADGGVVEINGEKVETKNIGIRSQIGYLPENNPLYTDLYVREYLEMVAGFYHLSNKKEKVMQMVELTGLQAEQHKKIGALSKGYRQRVGLAQALIHDPAVLILDEPTTGLDPNQLEEIRQLIRQISRNKTVMLSTHIMQEVEAVCTRVLIINKGTLVADGSIDQLKGGEIARKQTVLVEFDQMPDLSALQSLPGLLRLEQTGKASFLTECAGDNDMRPLLFNFAVTNHLVLLTLKEQQQSLENVFQELTRK
ncbi:MAG: gliding motility-associated ABC transporter ATP-binding subunit GldA [Methylococcaceae bacterium]|nr:gliding motility-associated ABC transporter ATP-binding subunit GldA [Prolixibacteraceae bacterium]